MLQKLSYWIRSSLERAAQARKLAAESGGSDQRRFWQRQEHRWNRLARSEDFSERVERFLANRQVADQVLERSTVAASHRDKRDHGGTIPGKCLICIIDDDTGVRESLERFILMLGYASGIFVTAEEYLDSGLLNETACLVCDVQLPGMSGPDLQARLIADGHRIPMVFVTGKFDEMTRARVLKFGALGYLAKPFGPGALISYLETALAGNPL